jgi:hypothetical protein
MIATNKILWYVSQLWEIFSKPQMWNLITMIMWLISEWKKSLLSISKKVIWSNNQSSLNRFINNSDWNEKELNNLRLKMLQNNKEFKIKWTWYFVIDDTLTEEFWKQMEWVGKFYDHTTWTYKNARNIIMLFYVEESICYPVDFRIYYKIESIWELDFKTKNELALEMIFEHMPEKKELQAVVLFDSWFSWRDFLQALDEKWYRFVTMWKANRNIFINKQKIKVPDLFKQTDMALWEIEWYDKIFTFVKWEYRDESQDKRDIYLISNINWLKTQEYMNKYDNRWKIEVWFKDFKQLFWWKDISFKSSLAVLRIIYISFFAYTISMKESFKQKINWVKATIWNICESLRKESLIELLKKIYAFWTKQIPLQSALLTLGFWKIAKS